MGNQNESGQTRDSVSRGWRLPVPFSRRKPNTSSVARGGQPNRNAEKQELSPFKDNALSQSVICQTTESPTRTLLDEVPKSSPSTSDDGDENYVNSKVRDLQINEKQRAAGHKRLRDEPADADRKAKHPKSPEALPESKLLPQGLNEKNNENPETHPMSSGNDTHHNAQIGPAPTDNRPGSGNSPNDNRGREKERTEKTNQLDRSTSLPEEGGGPDEEEDPPEGDTSMLPEPLTKAITPEQLVNEVKGIYSGLVMVEKKCVEIVNQRSQAGLKLSHDQWQALIALHRTLLHEHHDFFLASQHPAASPPLRRLALKYAMPARMWRNGIHAFLELLRQQLPESYDHMLAFVYIAYSMMALLLESVESFEETWIECLGDLARYRMAIEEVDMRDRDIWSNVARMWYNKAADLSPNVGRIQHHLAVLARPNVVMQLFYYSKALVSVVPFPNARESVMLLFSPFLEEEKAASTFQKYPILESSLVTAFGILFTRGRIADYTHFATLFSDNLDITIPRIGVRWKTQGPEVASSLIAGLVDFGNEQNFLWKAFNNNLAAVKARRIDEDETDEAKLELEDAGNREVIRKEFWQTVNEDSFEYVNAPTITSITGPQDKFDTSDSVTAHVLPLFYQTTSTVAQKIGDKNIVPFMSFILSFLWSLAYIPGGLMYLEAYVPWIRIITFLNTLGRSGVSEERAEAETFPQPISGTGRQLPEDFPMRGLIWAQYVFPVAFFRHFVTDEDERMLELPSHGPPRAERCLWLGMRLASLNRYFTFNVISKQFEATEFALNLERESANYTFGTRVRPSTATVAGGGKMDADVMMASESSV